MVLSAPVVLLMCEVCVPPDGCGFGMRRRIPRPHPSGGTPSRLPCGRPDRRVSVTMTDIAACRRWLPAVRVSVPGGTAPVRQDRTRPLHLIHGGASARPYSHPARRLLAAP